MDEEQLVLHLQNHFPFSGEKGIGDDASARRLGPDALGFVHLVAKDLLIENIHFELKSHSMEEAGEKSVAVNVSDMAAMGGWGTEIYTAIGIPPYAGRKDLFRLMSGIRRGCKRWSLELGGGDVSRAPCWMISVTILGRSVRPVYRSGACPGDHIGLIGRTGESALGLELIHRGTPIPLYSRRHVHVNPRHLAGPVLAGMASAMIDTSDGLIKDLKRILTASECGAVLESTNLPVTRRMRETCRQHQLDPLELALTGGEDYALLFTIAPRNLSLLQTSGLRFSLIGRIHANPKRLSVQKKGLALRVSGHGFDHFATP